MGQPGSVMRGFGQLPERWKSKTARSRTDRSLDVPSGELRIWRFVKGNPVNDGVVFWIRVAAYDLVKNSGLGVLEQSHEPKIHVQLLMTVEERKSGVIGDKINFNFLIASYHHHILHYAGS